jgi:hypothetical protein
MSKRLAVGLLAVLAACGCKKECVVDETYDPLIDPADFVATVDNPLMPLVPGTVYVYEGGGETIEVTVTSDTRDILGVTCVVVRDTVSVDGEIVEDTNDWFAQDVDGNVWYMGEDTAEYEDGEIVSTAGSWEAGVDGAKPGIVMPADPAVGDIYRQEYYACEAEDMGEIVSLAESADVPYGTFDNCLMTRDTTPLEPYANEHKYYCPGVGVVLEVDVNTGTRVELVSVTTL